jgi:hypothetical protein
MAKTDKKDSSQAGAAKSSKDKQRRVLLKKLGRFAAVSAPTVTLLLAAKAKPGIAQTSGCMPSESSRAFKTRIGPVNSAAVLAAVTALPIKLRRG